MACPCQNHNHPCIFGDAEMHESITDLALRSEVALMTLVQDAIESGAFSINDVVRAVERDLPENHPARTRSSDVRAGMITMMVEGMIAGEMYDEVVLPLELAQELRGL